jgi:hypothetical protein
LPTEKRTKSSRDVTMSIVTACADENLFAGWFRDPNTWAGWFVFLRALFGLPLTPKQLELFRTCTGRTTAPTEAATEGWLICGRRGGKSFVLALCAVFLATFRSYRQYLQPGERATVMVIATDRKQARVIFRYVRGLLAGVPMLAQMLDRERAESFDLSNHVTIEVAAASFRTTRGYAICAALLDELAFWGGEDSAEPDYEIINAIRPAMATIPGAMLLCASSPYAQRGALWDAWRKHFGQDNDPVLVWKAATRTMNPTVPQSVIDQATEHDPASAASEYQAEFRSDIAAFISREVLDACVARGCFERPPAAGLGYIAFCDPSGGSSDSMTVAVAHREANGVTVVDCVRERRAPFSPDAVVTEFAALLKSYNVAAVCGDRYGGQWPAERFLAHGISYSPSEKPKSDLYKELLPLLNSGRVELLDHQRLINQLAGLERRTARGGRDSIDHAPHAHDDVANAVAGALVLAHVSGSSLWARSALPIVASAPHVGLLFAVVVNNRHGVAGITFWSASQLRGGGLYLLDVLLVPLAPDLFHSVVGRLSELGGECGCPQSRQMLFAGSAELCAAFERLGYRSEFLDFIKDPLLPVSCASHITGGRVRVHERVLSQSQSVPLGFLQGGAAVDPDDALSLSFLVGCAMLDTGRSLGRAA